MKRSFVYITESKFCSRPIKDVLKNKFNMSSGLICALKKTDDGIMVNGKREFVNYILKPWDVLQINITEGASKNIEPVKGELDIIFEDCDFLAVNKSYDMPTHTSIGHHNDTLSNAVLYYLNQSGQEHTFHAVTRLDKDTSGVVLIAKNRYAHDLLSNQLRLGKIKKTYIAVVCGTLECSGVIDKKIKREDESIIKRMVSDDGDEALTEYEVIKSGENHSLVKAMPKTGRTHQIRVHFASIGHPITGDILYGGDEYSKRHLLHCQSLEFIHPIKKEKIKIEASLPQDFYEFFQNIGF